MKMQIAFIMLMLLLVAHAVDMVAINSMDGRDVLSGIFYANVKGLPVVFMPSQGGNADVFSAKVGTGHDVMLIQSSDPVSGFVESGLKANNNTVEVYPSADGGATNLYLANLSGASSFIVVGSAYSDSALSVLPYAKLTKSYVLLANKDNAQQVHDIVAGKSVTIYGLVDKEVSDALAPLNPQIIGTGEDKYEDNVAIVKKTMDEFNISRVIMADGTFIEDSMALGDQPILLSGQLIPQTTVDFITQYVGEGKLSQVMLIGNGLVVSTYDMRQKMKNDFLSQGQNKTFGIVVKFAQVIPSADSSVLNLDTFAMPAYEPSLSITDVAYNNQTGSIMVTVNNTGAGAAYYSMEVDVKLNGQGYTSFPAADPVIIESGEQKGSEFPFDMSNVTEGNLSAVVLVKYGASKLSLDAFSTYQGPLAAISYSDDSNVSVQAATYDADKKVLLVTLRNNGQGEAYSFSSVTLDLGGAPSTVTGGSTQALGPSSLVVEEFPLELSAADLAANNQVNISVDYGGRPGFLVKKGEFMMPLAEQGGSVILLVIGGVIVLVVVVIAAAAVLFVMGRKKKGRRL